MVNKGAQKGGFTLIELMIVLAIFVIMTGLLVANQRRFGANISLTNLSYDVSLSIREAQTYGLGVRGQAGDSNFLDNSYGVHFNTSNPSEYVLYLDENDNDIYDDENGNAKYDDAEAITTYQLVNGVTLTDLCAKLRDNPFTVECGKTSLDLTFTRPDPDAMITADENSTDYIKYGQARVCIVSANTAQKKQVQVLSSGQITVADDCPTN